MSPGDPPSKYDAEDTRDEPPWRQASFFGVRARGRFFVYVLDQSGSMVDDDRLTRATIELRRSVFALQSPQRFEVIFYNDEATSMPGGPIPRPADTHNKILLTSWLRLIDPDGETNPRRAVQQALALRPDAVSSCSPTAICPRGPSTPSPGQPPQDPDPLHRPGRRPGRRPPSADRRRQRRPIRLAPRQPPRRRRPGPLEDERAEHACRNDRMRDATGDLSSPGDRSPLIRSKNKFQVSSEPCQFRSCGLSWADGVVPGRAAPHAAPGPAASSPPPSTFTLVGYVRPVQARRHPRPRRPSCPGPSPASSPGSATAGPPS